MKRSLLRAAGAATLAAAALTACGTTDTDDAAGDPPAPRESATCAEDETTTSTGPVTLTDALGRTVELDQPAERVVALEWQQIEDVLSLCLTPVGVADVEGYTTWNATEPLPDGVADVGKRGEPNLDALFQTNPDLVIIEPYTADDPIIADLEEYGVPVLATAGADAEDPIAQMKETFSLIARATGREEWADVVLGDFDATLEETRAAVEEAAPGTDEFVYFDGYLQGGNVSLRPFGQGSLMGELGEELGLTNAWTGPVDDVYGLGQTDIEGMTEVGDATFFYTGTVDPEGSIFEQLEKNAVWAGLPAVEEGRVHAFPEGVWTFGGPRSGEAILHAYADVLTQESE